MKLKLDENLGRQAAELLKKAGHDVTTVPQRRWHALYEEQERWKRELERMTGKWEPLCKELEGVKQRLTASGLD